MMGDKDVQNCVRNLHTDFQGFQSPNNNFLAAKALYIYDC